MDSFSFHTKSWFVPGAFSGQALRSSHLNMNGFHFSKLNDWTLNDIDVTILVYYSKGWNLYYAFAVEPQLRILLKVVDVQN